MKKLALVFSAIMLVTAMCLPVAHAEVEDEVWTLVTQNGQTLTQIATQVNIGDEYIAQDNTLYIVKSVDSSQKIATVQETGEERPVSQAFFEARYMAVNSKRIGIYCTHSDESYEDGDGTSSTEKGWAGIHDVAATLKSWLEDKDIEVDFNTDSFLPHDAGAYRRSRSAAAELLKDGPAAILDIHRDGIPDESQYETEVDGKPMTMIRLLVGRSNPNSTENKQFAVQLKSVADDVYPGLIKDIFIGKGNYNQELMPDSLLLEFGTHTSDKEQVLASTEYMADVINMVVFGGEQGYSKKAMEKEKASAVPDSAVTPRPSADSTVSQQSARTASQEKSGSGIWIAIAIVIGAALAGLVIFGVVSNGSGGFGERIKRFSSEITGGLLGKKKE